VDAWANLFTLVPAAVYLAFNATIILTPERYATSGLYVIADVLYAVGSAFYLLSALRDDGWFWFMPLPLAGRCVWPDQQGSVGLRAAPEGHEEQGKALRAALLAHRTTVSSASTWSGEDAEAECGDGWGSQGAVRPCVVEVVDAPVMGGAAADPGEGGLAGPQRSRPWIPRLRLASHAATGAGKGRHVGRRWQRRSIGTDVATPGGLLAQVAGDASDWSLAQPLLNSNSASQPAASVVVAAAAARQASGQPGHAVGVGEAAAAGGILCPHQAGDDG
jgi:hypothetical protein